MSGASVVGDSNIEGPVVVATIEGSLEELVRVADEHTLLDEERALVVVVLVLDAPQRRLRLEEVVDDALNGDARAAHTGVERMRLATHGTRETLRARRAVDLLVLHEARLTERVAARYRDRVEVQAQTQRAAHLGHEELFDRLLLSIVGGGGGGGGLELCVGESGDAGCGLVVVGIDIGRVSRDLGRDRRRRQQRVERREESLFVSLRVVDRPVHGSSGTGEREDAGGFVGWVGRSQRSPITHCMRARGAVPRARYASRETCLTRTTALAERTRECEGSWAVGEREEDEDGTRAERRVMMAARRESESESACVLVVG